MRFGMTSVTVYAAVTCLTSMLKHAAGYTQFNNGKLMVRSALCNELIGFNIV